MNELLKQVHPSGKIVFVLDRGHQTWRHSRSIRKPDEWRLSSYGSTRGQTPRNFVIDPTGQYLLAQYQSSHDIHVFRVDSTSDHLNYINNRVHVRSPVCIKMIPKENR